MDVSTEVVHGFKYSTKSLELIGEKDLRIGDIDHTITHALVMERNLDLTFAQSIITPMMP